MESIQSANLNAVRLGGTEAVTRAKSARVDSANSSILTAQQQGWSVTNEQKSGIQIAGEEPVSDEVLNRNDALGTLISKAYGI